jgi:hypothetical protein
MAPETQDPKLSGEVYGHDRFPDGDNITTSTIIKVEGNVVNTFSGSKYELGQPSADYVEWCREQGCHIPTPEEPIKYQ